MVRREPVVLERAGQRLFGVIHVPGEPHGAPHPAVAIFHGLVGSKDQPHRLYVQLADALARMGIIALRIDFRGRGDSEGETIDITPEGDIADAAAALDYLAPRDDVDATRLGLVGHSWGGDIAACLAGRDRRVAAVVLWGSVPRGVAGWQPEFRTIDGRRAAELWGNLVGEQFYDGLRQIRTLDEVRRARGPLLLLHGTEDEAVAPEDVATARRELAAADVPHEVITIEGADHIFMRHEWKQEAVGRTVEWLRGALAASG